ncbi:MAG: hypothetical protein CMG35_04535 [Candidatus Marinimicrobia bacterium]|jgi:hypothetical protein|nr:hypothetical protein [Candidatus Neomarinimicrobiota bacterium]|tara:strand:- start:160 stop:342 length:183 start_codon:yes stop_codon:yes gene_type:complete
MSINDEREKERAEDKKLIDEWLAKGNKITVYPYGARSEEVEYTSGMYAKRKKKGDKKTKK